MALHTHLGHFLTSPRSQILGIHCLLSLDPISLLARILDS